MGATMSIPNLEQPARDGAASGRPDALSDSERWYAVHTLPFAEARAECQLSAKDFGRSSRNGTRPFGTRAK